ncbi:MAG: 16S rRNA (guanine(527)-N(7))-methyltransferase RsmG [Salibacteraceae bacterium]
MSHEEGLKLIQGYFPELSQLQLKSLKMYVLLLLEKNKQINLISRKNQEEVWVNHIVHSLAITKVLRPSKGQSFIDFGTGGGLPGIPLAIVFPDCKFLLVDSVGKKIKAVTEMVEALGLENVSLRNERVENIDEHFDFAVSRAVTSLPKIKEWLKGKIKKGKHANLSNGLLYIKGGDFSDELIELGSPYQIWEISSFFNEPFFETKKVVWVATTA